MTRGQFRNHVASLYNIDKRTIDEKLVSLGQEPFDDYYWNRFRENPPRFFMNTDAETAEAIWQCVLDRQPKE